MTASIASNVILLVFRKSRLGTETNTYLAGFDRYKGGLDTVHDLTGFYSVFTQWRGIEVMFHVSTLLPHESNDPQKVTLNN